MSAKSILGMMDEGIVIKEDPALPAAELTAPAVLLIAQADRQPQCENDILESIERHIRQQSIYKVIRYEKGGRYGNTKS